MLKKVLSEVKEYKLASILTPLFMILEVVVEMYIPKLMSRIIDDGVNAGNITVIIQVGAMMVGAALFGLFAGIMGGKFGAKCSTGLAKNLRMAEFKKIQTFSFKNIDKFSVAGLVTRLTTDVTAIQNSYQMVLRMGTRAPITLIVAMVMAFSISSELAIIYVYAILGLLVVMIIMMAAVSKYFKLLFEKYDALNASTQENITGMRVVKAYVREAYEKTRFKKASGDLKNIGIKAEKLMAFASPIMMFAVYGCILLISWLGANLIVTDQLKTGELMSMLAYCMNILISLLLFAAMMVMMVMSQASVKRVGEVLSEEPDICDPKNPVTDVADGSIEFRNVSFSYNDDGHGKVLEDINVSIKSGEMIGIMGQTGSSKTTLVSLISRLYDVTDGEILVGGVNVKDYSLDTLRREVSHVLQNNVLFSGTILDNLRWGDADASEEECIKACKSACADEFISKFSDGYNTYIEQGGSNVSGGQRQRLCIARALLRKPKIIVLDDSTSAVDTATDAKIRKAFREDIPNTTKLIIAQRISSIQDADRIIVMEDGHINGIGTHEELLANNEIYRDVYESQTGVGSGDFDKVGGED